MRRLILCFVLATLLTTASAFAGEGDEPLRWRGFETNRFWDNWEVAVGGGNSFLQLSQKMGSDPGKFFKRNGWNANLSTRKWFAPVLGMRLQVDAGEFRNYSYDMSRFGSGAFKTPYIFVHGDILINMSNWIGGYKPDRLYSAISYLGFGYTAMSWTKNSVGSYNGEFAFSSGFLSKFRVIPQLDIELDLRTWLFAENSLPAQIRSGGRYTLGMSASVGVAYRFSQREWSRAYPEVVVDGYILEAMALEEQLIARDRELQSALSEVQSLTSKNRSLAKDLEQSKMVVDSEAKRCVVPECVVFFEIGQSRMSDYAKATLDNYIEQVKELDSPLMVVGYADKETGSATRNEQLSKERANSVANYMESMGIDPNRITTTWVGDNVEAFTSPDSPIVNRCVIIE